MLLLDVLHYGYNSKKKGDKKSFRTYRVRQGDTFCSLARRFCGNESKWRYLMDLNRVVTKGSDKLFIGMAIKIPIKDVLQ